MKPTATFWHMLINFTFIVLAILFSWTAAFYITNFLYIRIEWVPHELLAFLINAMFGFFIFGLILAVIGSFVKRNERHFWSELIDALRRISRGDFHVTLDTHPHAANGKQRNNHPYSQLVDSINDMAANLKMMEELRQEFISNVSHEIGSPLTSISGFAKALKNEQLDHEKKERYLTIIETECQRLSKLSENLMKLAILDSDRHPLKKQSYRLDKQLVTLILACEPQWEAKKIEMQVDAAEVDIVADADLLSQVWINLLQNAIKFTTSHGKIAIHLCTDDTNAIVHIIDSGTGIAEEDQARIFERFYMVDESRERLAGGSGLGLSIVSKIIDLHNGSITVSSKLGQGTKFEVQIPLHS